MASKAFCFVLLPLLLTCGLCVEYSLPSARLGEFLRNFVTYYPAATKDPSGKEVIGYGHICVSAGCADVSGFKQPLTVSDAAKLLEQDLQEASRCVSVTITSPVSRNKYDALTLFAYNVGCDFFKKTAVVKAVNGREPDSAVVKAFADYIWTDGKIYQTSVEMRAYEASLYHSTD